MQTVVTALPGWFVYVLDAAIIAIAFAAAMVAAWWKRGRYQKEAIGCIRAEIQLPTGWSEFYVAPCDLSAKTITINDFIYFLNPERRRYGRHPLNPFMGLGVLQVPIRIETWFKDDPEPMRQHQSASVATAAEIKAMTREIQATTAAMQIQEIDARQNELTKAIANQPNKMVVYVMLGLAIVASIVTAILVFRYGGGAAPSVPGV